MLLVLADTYGTAAASPGGGCGRVKGNGPKPWVFQGFGPFASTT